MLTQPAPAAASAGDVVAFTVEVAAFPAATHQLFKNGAVIRGATASMLKLVGVQPRDAADYTVTVTNAPGTASSRAARLEVK